MKNNLNMNGRQPHEVNVFAWRGKSSIPFLAYRTNKKFIEVMNEYSEIELKRVIGMNPLVLSIATNSAMEYEISNFNV